MQHNMNVETDRSIGRRQADKQSAVRRIAVGWKWPRWLAIMAALLVEAGCHTPTKHAAKDCVCMPRGPCGGYFSTCWRQWPPECVSCPPLLEASDAAINPPPPNEVIPPPSEAPSSMPYAPAPPSDVAPPVGNDLGPNGPTSGSKPDMRYGHRRPPQPVQSQPRPILLNMPMPEETVVFRRTTVQLREPAAEPLSAPPGPPTISDPIGR